MRMNVSRRERGSRRKRERVGEIGVANLRRISKQEIATGTANIEL